MSYIEWKDKTAAFKQIDVRGIQGNFFQGIKRQAMQLTVGNGLEIVQSFDPIPLYEVMEGLGFEHYTEQKGDAEFHAYFYRVEEKQEEKDIPMRPAALTNMPLIDEKLGNIAVNFWDLTWNDENRHLPYEMRLLLSLTNAVGAGRMRQATRELVKAYIHTLAPRSARPRFLRPTRASRIWKSRARSVLRSARRSRRNTARKIRM